MAKSKSQIIKEILEKYPVEPRVSETGFKWIKPNDVRYTRNKAMRAAGIRNYIDELGHEWKIEGGGKNTSDGTFRNIDGDRRLLERAKDPRTNRTGSKYSSLRQRADRRVRNLIESNATEAEINKGIRKAINEHNAALPKKSPDRLVLPKNLEKWIYEHRISQADWKRLGLPGNPADSHNIWITTAREAKQKTRIESILRKQGKDQTHYVDFNPETRSMHVLPVEEFSVGKEALGGLEITEAEWSSPDFNPKAKLNTYAFEHREAKGFVDLMDTASLEQNLRGKVPLSVQNETVDAALDIQGMANEAAKVERAIGQTNQLHTRNKINSRLNSVFTTDPSSELYEMGLWYDGKTLDDSWVKITRELNTDSGTFANGKWTPAPDPTARTNIDILSDIGQGQGEFEDIIDLKNKFQNLKRTLPPGEYYMHADNPTKAKYYQRAFRNDPWITLSGEQGAGKNKKGVVERYDTLKLTVPDVDTQLQQVTEGVYPRWQDQGVPQSNKKASDIARRTEAQLLASRPVLREAAEASGGLRNALRKAGTVLPFVGAGLDAWDVQQRWEEAMNNPNEGFTDWLDKAQLAIAGATLGTSFWAEPANFVLGVGNLAIDAGRTIFEEDKRDNFLKLMRSIGRGSTYAAQQSVRSAPRTWDLTSLTRTF